MGLDTRRSDHAARVNTPGWLMGCQSKRMGHHVRLVTVYLW